MVDNRYIKHFILTILLWVAFYFLMTLSINPYGVSPVKISIDRFNKYKPKRLDIDRLIKPYEVWRYQPKTVFLGTSRTHQSIDPSIFNGTRFAPAYNASIPASSLGMNISHLEQYISLDKNLKVVFIELFFWNFLGQGMEHYPKSFKEYFINTLNLFISSDTLWDSVVTVQHNFSVNKPVYEIKPGGYFYYPPGHNAQGPFDGFAKGIWDLHETRKGVTKLHIPAIDAVSELIELCKKNNIELFFILTPNHAYSDYYIDDIKAWGVVKQWLTELTNMHPTIYSFSQANDWMYEEVSKDMRYWNDPFHFSLKMGRMMLHSIMGTPDDNRPDNFFVLMTADKVESYIRNQKEAITLWANNHTEFTEQYKAEKLKTKNPKN